MPSGQMLLNPTLRRALAVQETPDSATDTPVATPVATPSVPISNPIIQQALTTPTTPVVNAQVPNTTDAALSVGEPTKQPDQIAPTMPAVIANPQVVIPQTTVDTTPAHGPASAAAQANAPVDPITGLPVAAAGPATVAADIQQGTSVTPEQIASANAMQAAQVAANQGGGLNAFFDKILPILAIGGTAGAFLGPELLSALGGATEAGGAAAAGGLDATAALGAGDVAAAGAGLTSGLDAAIAAQTAALGSELGLGSALIPAAAAAAAPTVLDTTAALGAGDVAAAAPALTASLPADIAASTNALGTQLASALFPAAEATIPQEIVTTGTRIPATAALGANDAAAAAAALTAGLPEAAAAQPTPTSVTDTAGDMGEVTVSAPKVTPTSGLDSTAALGALDAAAAANALMNQPLDTNFAQPTPNYASPLTSALESAASKFLKGLLGGTGTGAKTGAGGAGGGTAAAAQPFQAPAIPTQNIPQAYEYVMQNYAGPQTLPLGQYVANAPQVSLPQYQAPQAAQQGGIMDVTGSNMDQGQLAALMAALQGQQNG